MKNEKLANKKGKTRNKKIIKQRNKEKMWKRRKTIGKEEKRLKTRGTISERDENSDQKLKPCEKRWKLAKRNRKTSEKNEKYQNKK